MVCYLSELGKGIERYAEIDSGVMDVPPESSKWGMQYLEPNKVHPSALKENVSVRQKGYWLNSETMPKRYLWANGDQALPDVMPGFVVSIRFKDLVERFEPGVHQFVPIDIYKQRSGQPVATYYWFIVGQRLDSIDTAHTTYRRMEPEESASGGAWSEYIIERNPLKMTKIAGAKLVFSNEKVEGHHILHDPQILTFSNGLCSDHFCASGHR